MTDIHPMLEQRRAERRARDHYSHEFRAAMFDELVAALQAIDDDYRDHAQRYPLDVPLQSIRDARAVLAKCRGQAQRDK